MRHTQILQPIDTDIQDQDVTKLQEDNKQVKILLKKVPEEVQDFDGWLKLLDMKEETYMVAVRFGIEKQQVFLQHGPQDNGEYLYERPSPCLVCQP